jgi:hypothetical protein
VSISTWVETVPSGTSFVGLFPQWAKTMWTAVGVGMGVEHLFEGSGGGASGASSGDMRPGGSRAYFDVQSKSSAPGSQQTSRLFLASDVSRLFVYDSTGTYMVGTAFGDEAVSDPTTPGMWARLSGSFTTTATSGTTDVTFAVPFTAFPSIVQTINSASGAALTTIGIVTTSSSTLKFRSVWSATAAPGTIVIAWTALGPVSSASY